jgi:hypothetical protein
MNIMATMKIPIIFAMPILEPEWIMLIASIAIVVRNMAMKKSPSSL